MSASIKEWTIKAPHMPAPLDPGYQPAALFNMAYREQAQRNGGAEPLVLALERENGLVARYETIVNMSLPMAFTRIYVERIVKFLLWSRGGWKLHFGGPESLGSFIRDTYAPTGARAFDVELMGRVYEHPFEVALMRADQVPADYGKPSSFGGHLDGCRIGFDLGASDFKLASVKDGEVVFSTEIPWTPRDQADPDYHYHLVSNGLKEAASHLPRVDAIGGSSAGVVVNNRMMVASLFRSVPANRYEEARTMFLRLQKEWNVPLEVINDGEVTALAGSLSLNQNGVLGIAMGSSEACGYICPDGHIQGWLDELAFAPVDYNPEAPPDEWSGDRGVGAMYFSQQAVNKLAPAAQITFAENMPLPERLKQVQDLMDAGNPEAAKIYETLGIYLGYTIPHYADFYDIQHVLTLGRVLSGPGGLILIEKANEVLKNGFPDLGKRISLNLPDEKSRRVGQAVAAASIPKR